MVTERMTFYLIVILCLHFVFLGACAKAPHTQNDTFLYQDIPIAKGTIGSGEGNSVQFRGSNLALSGKGISPGDHLRHVSVASKDLSLIDVVENTGRPRIINVVPSIDTKVCEQQTHYLSERNQGLDSSVDLITISVDTPFAQDRFAKEANIHNVTFLSDYRGGHFGQTHGLLLKEPHLLARAVLVVDSQNVIRYLQVTPNLGHMPDMEAAFTAARALMRKSSESSSP